VDAEHRVRQLLHGWPVHAVTVLQALLSYMPPGALTRRYDTYFTGERFSTVADLSSIFTCCCRVLPPLSLPGASQCAFLLLPCRETAEWCVLCMLREVHAGSRCPWLHWEGSAALALTHATFTQPHVSLCLQSLRARTAHPAGLS
jgi:hypothetical protein